MKEILFEKCNYYGKLADAIKDKALHDMYIAMWSSLYEVINESGLGDEFAAYQIEH